MSRGGRRRAGTTKPHPVRQQQRPRKRDDEGIFPELAKAVRQVENAMQRGSVMPTVRTTFQAVAILVREERARIKADTTITEATRNQQLKRLDGIATILATSAARDTSLLVLLAEEVQIPDAVRELRRDMLRRAGLDTGPDPDPEPETAEVAPAGPPARTVPQSVMARQLANPFLTPDFSQPPPPKPASQRLATWELLGPLFRAFETASGGAVSCMELPEPDTLRTRDGLEMMRHQAEMVTAAAEGHRTFLLADEPGLGKTAQALLAAQATDSYPLLVVVPNVVKTSWAREAAIWTPRKAATVVHGDGDDVDGFADIVVVNYDILDRHVGWLGNHGFRGMVVDEAHFIKNKTSQRSQHVLGLADSIRRRTARPLMMALTGTPLINDVEDFRAIWQFLGWIGEKAPTRPLMAALEETGLTPLDPGFYPAARQSVIDLGIVRRRKAEVASDIPARRVADLPVELDGEAGRSIRAAERELARRMVARYETALETRRSGRTVQGIDHDLVRQVATWEREETSGSTGSNVFGMMRRIGQAKSGLAADYAAQLVRNVGKVVFFAKHVDVMDTAEELFTQRGIRYSSIRGDQTSRVRQKNIDAFVNDPDVEVAVCSLTAAGVGLNLQVASNLVLAELSWTDAEQTQAIDRVHRIGQDEPVTVWRVIATQTLDVRVAELIDSKAGLAARALDGSDAEVSGSADVQLEALVALLTDALERAAA